jgi:hypothetical protein
MRKVRLAKTPSSFLGADLFAVTGMGWVGCVRLWFGFELSLELDPVQSMETLEPGLLKMQDAESRMVGRTDSSAMRSWES